MPQRRKIFNDPVYGFVSVPYGLLLHLIDHPYFQRLRRIRQTGLANYVYPGALHTRFHHALGALHLMQQAVETLQYKGVAISEAEAEAVCIAILLHDIGHGPFSHALEHTIVDMHHETLSLRFMEALNEEFEGRLELAIAIFNNQYDKPFLHQLVSGQLDMDRMDYLNRDSFFTGVSEGVIGYDRIIKMLDVHQGQLVVEEKGIYSVENFLIARRLMYWQVYLHKTNLSAELMLTHVLRRARELTLEGRVPDSPRYLRWFLEMLPGSPLDPAEMLKRYARLDDNDVISAIKYWTESPDAALSFLSNGLLHRRLYRLEWHTTPIKSDYSDDLRQRALQKYGDTIPVTYLVFEGAERNRAYNPDHEPINILFKNKRIRPLTECSDVPLYTQTVTKFYICYPKGI
jgi:uncharacterized protein